jgi:hypothetical protein
MPLGAVDALHVMVGVLSVVIDPSVGVKFTGWLGVLASTSNVKALLFKLHVPALLFARTSHVWIPFANSVEVKLVVAPCVVTVVSTVIS